MPTTARWTGPETSKPRAQALMDRYMAEVHALDLPPGDYSIHVEGFSTGELADALDRRLEELRALAREHAKS